MLLGNLVLYSLFNLSWRLFNRLIPNRLMRPWMRCILKRKIMKSWGKVFSTSLILIPITLPNPLRVTNSLNLEESPPTFSGRTGNSNNPSSFPRKTKCTKTPLRLLNKLTTPKSLRIYWSFSLRKNKKNSLQPLFTHVMNTLDQILSWNMLGGLECMSSPCHTWFNLSLSLRQELRLFTRRMRTEKRKNNNKPNKKWTSHLISLPMILT